MALSGAVYIHAFKTIQIIIYRQLKYIVGSRGVEQLEGPDPWYNRGGPTKVGARKSYLNPHL